MRASIWTSCGSSGAGTPSHGNRRSAATEAGSTVRVHQASNDTAARARSATARSTATAPPGVWQAASTSALTCSGDGRRTHGCIPAGRAGHPPGSRDIGADALMHDAARHDDVAGGPGRVSPERWCGPGMPDTSRPGGFGTVRSTGAPRSLPAAARARTSRRWCGSACGRGCRWRCAEADTASPACRCVRAVWSST